MSRRIAVGLVLVVGFLVVGLILSALQRARLSASLATSRNNLRELALFAHVHANPETAGDAGIPSEIPPGTVVLPDIPPANRLSWVVHLMPVLDQKRQDTVTLLSQLDQTQPWSAEGNQRVGQTPVVVLICPGATPKATPDAPAITSYVGISGLAPPDPATIPLPVGAPPPPQAGAWRYDAPTPFARITDGLSQTLLFGETANDPGPWLRGGQSTLRGLDNARDAKPLVGGEGQFGGYFPGGGHFARCDGSVQFFTDRTTPGILLRLATIADGRDEVPVE